MKVLLDTNVLLIWLAFEERRTQRMAEVIASERNQLFFSPLSIWESGIKVSKGKLRLPTSLVYALNYKRFEELAFTSAHGDEAARLPLVHHDPFDRGLIAQARIERLTLLTTDRKLSAYDVDVVIA